VQLVTLPSFFLPSQAKVISERKKGMCGTVNITTKIKQLFNAVLKKDSVQKHDMKSPKRQFLNPIFMP